MTEGFDYCKICESRGEDNDCYYCRVSDEYENMVRADERAKVLEQVKYLLDSYNIINPCILLDIEQLKEKPNE